MSGTITIRDKAFRTLYSEAAIAEAVSRIAARINSELAEKVPVFLAVLNGAFIFAADLLREIRIPCEISFIRLKSYEATSSTGSVKTMIGLEAADLADRTVVIIEDIVDTGLTVDSLSAQLNDKRVGDLRIATLLFKPSSYKFAARPDYVGFEIPDQFVVGYGMDYCGEGRNLKDVYVLA